MKGRGVGGHAICRACSLAIPAAAAAPPSRPRTEGLASPALFWGVVPPVVVVFSSRRACVFSVCKTLGRLQLHEATEPSGGITSGGAHDDSHSIEGQRLLSCFVIEGLGHWTLLRVPPLKCRRLHVVLAGCRLRSASSAPPCIARVLIVRAFWHCCHATAYHEVGRATGCH